jgi:hypothetical protein
MKNFIGALLLFVIMAVFNNAMAAADQDGVPWYEEGELWTGVWWKDSMWITMNVGFIGDWAQTRYIADHPEDHTETNTILGPHPTSGEVNRYFIGTIIEANAIYYFMPDSWKPVLSGLHIKQRYDAITHNKELGIKYQF